MSDLLIRDVPEEIMVALSQKARAVGKDRLSFVRDLLIKVPAEPIITERYAIRFYADEGPAKGSIRRFSGGVNGVGGGCSDLSEDQFGAYKKAQDLVRRNSLGDREEAIFLLKSHFNNVFEVPV